MDSLYWGLFLGSKTPKLTFGPSEVGHILLIIFMEKDVFQGLLLSWKILTEGYKFSIRKWMYSHWQNL